jgi:hypothetical protein
MGDNEKKPSMMEKIQLDRARIAAVERTKIIDNALPELEAVAQEMVSSLQSLQLKIQRGEKIPIDGPGGRGDLEIGAERLMDLLEGVLGKKFDSIYKSDCEMAQQLVNDFVDELKEDDNLPSGIVRSLEDSGDCMRTNVSWRSRHEHTEERSVTVNVPHAILGDEELRYALKERLTDLESDLCQAANIDDDECNHSELNVSEG